MEMTKKSMVQVVIGGKVLTMGGYDDETHIQRIASCVNRVLRQMEDACRCLRYCLQMSAFIIADIV